jgi:hypothetical protein
MQYGILISLSLLVLVLTGIVYHSHSRYFARFFGKSNPAAVILSVSVLGLLLLSFLVTRHQFVVFKTGDLGGRIPAIGIAIPLAAIMILVDRQAIFAADMNVPFPESLLFYPVMGYVVEILFHVLPLAVLFLLLGAFVKGPSQMRIVWVSIVLIALLEPAYQAIPMIGRYAT